MKDDFGGRIIKKFVSLRRNMHSYLTDDGYVDKRPKSKKNFVIKR